MNGQFRLAKVVDGGVLVHSEDGGTGLISDELYMQIVRGHLMTVLELDHKRIDMQHRYSDHSDSQPSLNVVYTLDDVRTYRNALHQWEAAGKSIRDEENAIEKERESILRELATYLPRNMRLAFPVDDERVAVIRLTVADSFAEGADIELRYIVTKRENVASSLGPNNGQYFRAYSGMELMIAEGVTA